MATDFNGFRFSGRTETSAVSAPFKVLRVLGAASLALSMLGCSTISDSISESVSTSVSSPFKWSSASSSSGSSEERKETYQGDIRKFTEVCSRSSCGAPEMTRGITAIAEKYGVTNWEADNSTYIAIGEGLAKAHTLQARVDVYKSALSQGNATVSDAIQKGYDHGR
jgi:hypothetical protein